MKNKKILYTLILTSVLLGCSTEKIPTPEPIQTRDQVLNPKKYYVPVGLDVEFKLHSSEMRIIDVLKQIEEQSAYTYQIYDVEEIGLYRVSFEDRKLTSIEALKVIDRKYEDKIKIIIDEESRYITIKKLN